MIERSELESSLARIGTDGRRLRCTEDALEFVAKRGEHACEAELHRRSGELRLLQKSSGVADAHFQRAPEQRALEVAREQRSRINQATLSSLAGGL